MSCFSFYVAQGLAQNKVSSDCKFPLSSIFQQAWESHGHAWDWTERDIMYKDMGVI